MAKEIAEEYASSLSDLTINSKPLINMLTILAEENIEHAGVIVETVEKHLEKVTSDIKLPVLYLVDSIIKNVGGAYIQKFAQSIVNMFTKTFKQVDEKTRSQMFKLRETWHDVFPSTKLYQLDVKVNLIDPAWPIQAQPPHTSSIHPAATTSTVATPQGEEQMKSILAKKEQELLRLQRKKIEMELELTRRQLDQAEKTTQNQIPQLPVVVTAGSYPTSMPVALVNPTVPAAMLPQTVTDPSAPIKSRLGPPVQTKSVSTARITPASGAMVAAARRDPRLQRLPQQPPIAPNVFDIKPLDRVTKRKNAITIDVRPEVIEKEIKARDPRRRDPRITESKSKDIDERRREKRREVEKKREDRRRDEERRKHDEAKRNDIIKSEETAAIKEQVDDYMTKLQIPDPKKINKLPPIPKISRHEDKKEDVSPSPTKRRKELAKPDKKVKKRDSSSSKDSSDSQSPDKRGRNKDTRKKTKEQPMEVDEKAEQDVVAFKELKNYNKDRYRRNREKSESPDKVPDPPKLDDTPTEITHPTVPEVVDTKDVDLRVLPGVEEVPPAPILQKRPSTENAEVKTKKSKLEKFDILFGSEDVDLRQLPQVEETTVTNNHTHIEASPKLDKSPKSDPKEAKERIEDEETLDSSPKRETPPRSPKKDWNEVKEKSEEPKKTPTKLDLVRAKLAEATKGKDRLGRPLLFTKSPSIEKENRVSITEDVDLRTETEDEVNKETINMILSQAKEHFKDGKMDKNQYNTLMFQVMQLNEKLKLKEAKQRESLEMSKRKLIRVRKSEEVVSPKSSPSTREHNRFGDIDERVPPSFMDTPPDSQDVGKLDSDMRLISKMDGPSLLPHPPMPMFMMPGPMGPGPMGSGKIGPGPMNSGPLGPTGPMNHLGPMHPMGPQAMPTSGPMGPNMPMGPNGPMPNGQMPQMGPMPASGPFPPMWRGRPRAETFRGQRPVASAAPFFRGTFDKRAPRPQFEYDPRFGPPMPKIGMGQGERPYPPYQRSRSPPPLGTPGIPIPPTDLRIIDYIDQDPMRTIDIDGVAREIRFYGETAIVMLDWDDPREIRFLPGSRRINFDNKDSVVLNLNDGYKQVEIEDQVFDIRYGAPTRELYINGKWYECFFGDPPCAIIIDGKTRLITLEGPAPQVDIGKEKRTDLVAGKINLIIDAQQMCPIFLDAKVQKFAVDGQLFTIRFVDGLKTVLINEQPFAVEFGGLPRPIYVGNSKHFIRFSVVPRHVKPGQCEIVNMEGVLKKPELKPLAPIPKPIGDMMPMDVDLDLSPRPDKPMSPDGDHSNHGGLDMLASLMPTSMAPASTNTGYSAAEPAYNKPDKIPGLDPAQGQASGAVTLPLLGNINVNDLFAKLVATGIVHVHKDEEDKEKKLNKNVVHKVDLLKPETLRIKQPALITKLYNGMQCSGCGTRFPPEHTVKYSQHLDWHFRQNRRERDSARRAHSRHWHYDLSDWVQYEEVEDLEEREKSWFETGGGTETEGEQPAEVPEETLSVPSGAPTEQFCALCGDKFDQFYNEDKEEWHLRKAVNYEDRCYHPMCFEDYKASQSKKEAAAAEAEAADQSVIEIPVLDKVDEPIEIADVDDLNSQSDYESDVEVLENKKEEIQEILDDPPEELPPPPAETTAAEPAAAAAPSPTPTMEAISEDSGDEDDVVLKTDPVEEVLVEECDTDDETTATRKERDHLVDLAKVKIKQEPIDPDDEPVITSEEQAVRAKPDSTNTTVLSSIDGNVQFDSSQSNALPAAPIRINISKSIPTFLSSAPSSDRTIEEMSTDDEPLPPGEEIEIEYKLKPTLEGIEFSRQPPVQRGTELSGLCSIM